MVPDTGSTWDGGGGRAAVRPLLSLPLRLHLVSGPHHTFTPSGQRQGWADGWQRYCQGSGGAWVLDTN